MMMRRRPFGFEGQFEMTDDPVDGLRLLDKRDDSHPAATRRTDQWIHLINLADHPGPAFGERVPRPIKIKWRIEKEMQ